MDAQLAELLGKLVQMCGFVAQGNYEGTEGIFELTRDGDYPAIVSELAESFGMMLVRVEARELRLKQLLEKMRNAQEEEKQLLTMTAAISTELDLKTLLLKIMNTAQILLDAERSALFLYDAKTHELYAQLDAANGLSSLRFSAEQGIAGQCFLHKRTINISDAYSDTRFNPEIDRKTGFQTRAILCAPIVNKNGDALGVIQLLNKRGSSFSAVDETRLHAFSAQASMALENAQLFEDVLNLKNYNESILESLSNGVVTLSPAGQIVKCNSATQRILGLSGSLEDCAIQAFLKAENAWLTDSIQAVNHSGQTVVHMDVSLKLPDNRTASVNSTIVPLLSTQKTPMGTMVVLEDITREKRLKSTMARYMSPELAERLLQEGESVLGGKIQEVSVLFSDIRSFTTLSEQLGPKETVSMLNDYFSVMADIVLMHGGIVDKYIGDAIMAVFGTPFTTARDADNAVQAAVDMLRALRIFNAARAPLGKAPVEIGLGINTGEVVAGNIGSLKRMDYTVIGDGVNTASRLEGATKYYGTRLLISESTRTQLNQQYQCRIIDSLRVKGKNLPVSIYEVLDYHDAITFPHHDDVLALYHDGLTHYQNRDWQAGIRAFSAVTQLNADDGPSIMYLQRCQQLLAHPPADDWDGVWTMQSK